LCWPVPLAIKVTLLFVFINIFGVLRVSEVVILEEEFVEMWISV